LLVPNRKGVSTLILILLLLISAVVGGIITYMFAIAPFIEVPERTTVNITNVYIDKENATSFKIGVLNPSYSSTNATITRIAINLKGESQLYDITETNPQIGNGITLQRSETLNITCSKVGKDGANVTWGEVAGEFAGKTIAINVFSPDALAANIEKTLPNVKLDVLKMDFDSEVSFRSFNVTVTNPNSEINLTISKIRVSEIELKENETSPQLPKTVAINETVEFMCNAIWHDLGNTTLKIYTQEGYIFSEDLTLQTVHAEIQKLTFNEDSTDHFNVTIFNFPESANYVNVTKIVAALENETTVQNDYPSVGIMPNSTSTFIFDWSWKEYRGKNISVTVYFLQDFETETYMTKTPAPVIVKVLNEKEVFDLRDPEHFNITLQNHPSSLKAINITQIIAEKPNGAIEIINGTASEPQLPYGPIEPGQAMTFHCTIAKWTVNAGKNLTLTVYTLTNQTLDAYAFDFMFTLPAAELNITSMIHIAIDGTKYLNITVENAGYSVWDITLLKVTIAFGNGPEPLEQTFPKNQIIIKRGEGVVLICAFDWEGRLGENIIVTVITVEGVEASWQGTAW